MKLYTKSVEMASKDTTYDDIRRQSLVYLGNLAADSAEITASSVPCKTRLLVGIPEGTPGSSPFRVDVLVQNRVSIVIIDHRAASADCLCD
jgi:hypothetical protein